MKEPFIMMKKNEMLEHTQQDLEAKRELILYEVEMLGLERGEEYILISDVNTLDYEQCIERLQRINSLKPMDHVMYNAGRASMKVLRLSVAYKLHQKNA